ncbi:FAD/NAD(P)-binding protein [Allorhizobium terrae]|uniref:Hydroxyacylglutathione hydrolase n=1 Tax=Allorhizobium terrae TaxID=1848972 RepID=A0A4S4A674_9HYPH|nr:FAD/NAD(P)-binding protein [Allorhizobium terrae]THF54058.1 hydroxyacylglutathione hydrolase [Allorhizobium terrae]
MISSRPVVVPVIVIVGGGFTGAVLAIHLAKRHGGGGAVRIIVFEPRERLGAGLAYSTSEPTHRINVPAGKMTVYPEDPESFLRFATDAGVFEQDPEAFAESGLPYPRRSAFGDYVAAEITPHLQAGVIEHRRASVSAIEKATNGWLLHGSDGSAVSANVVVIAVSHPAPTVPAAFAAIADHPKFIADATRDNALASIEANDRVLLVGNGLTSADVIATLNAKGHRGSILAISRRGLRSRGHAVSDQEPFGDFLSKPCVRASDLLHRVRLTLRQAQNAGLSWHAVIDAVRAQGQQIWQALPVAERRRLARFVRPFWDVHRFRIAPQVEQVLDAAIQTGQLSVRAGSVQAATLAGQGFDVRLRDKQNRAPLPIHVDAIIVTTGPAHGGILTSQPFLEGLHNSGVLSACETGLGIACDLNAVARDPRGIAVPGLFIAGPLARGTFGELMGLPQVTEHAIFVADQVEDSIGLAATPHGNRQAS